MVFECIVEKFIVKLFEVTLMCVSMDNTDLRSRVNFSVGEGRLSRGFLSTGKYVHVHALLLA